MSTAYENAIPRTMKSAARYHPGARSRADISRTTSSLRRLRQELHQGVDLGPAQGTPVVGRHDPLGVALRDLRVGLHDGLLDERRVLALEELVEVRPRRAARARLRQLVAGAARRRAGAVLAVREQRRGLPRGPPAAPPRGAGRPPPPRPAPPAPPPGRRRLRQRAGPPAAPPAAPPCGRLVRRTHAANCGFVMTCAVWRMNA